MSISTNRTAARLEKTKKAKSEIQTKIDSITSSAKVQIDLITGLLAKIEALVLPELAADATDEQKAEQTKLLADMQVEKTIHEESIEKCRAALRELDTQLAPLQQQVHDLSLREADQEVANLRRVLTYPVRLSSHLRKCHRSKRSDVRTKTTLKTARDEALKVAEAHADLFEKTAQKA